MNDKEFERALETVVAGITNDTAKFGDAALAIAGVAGSNREHLEQIKIWTDALERVVFGDETKKVSADLMKHIDHIRNDKSISSCVVFLTDGKNCAFYRHGDSDEFCLGMEAVIAKDKSGEVYDTMESIVYEAACDDVDKLAMTLSRFNALVGDLEKEGISVPKVEAEFPFDNELDLFVTAKME